MASPSIYNLKFDSKTYFPTDVISQTPTIEMFLSAEAGATLEVKIGVDATGIYSDSAKPGYFVYRVPDERKIAVGPHTIRVTLSDSLGNITEEVFADLVVIGDPVKLSGLTFYQQVFSPEEGQKVSISYNLSYDADITVYIYNSKGDLIWEKLFLKESPGAKRGFNNFNWDGKDLSGRIVHNGYYNIKMVSGNRSVGAAKVIVMD